MPSSILLSLALATTPALPSSGPATFDIAGVRLAMSPASVRDALLAKGYRIERTDLGLSFEQSLKSEADRALNRPSALSGEARTPLRIVADGPNAELLTLDLTPWPGGPVVSGITLRVPGNRQSPQDVRTQVESKFGRPSFGMGGADFTWCTTGDPGCTRMTLAQQPTLRVTYTNDSQLWLTLGPGLERQLSELHRQAFEALVPPAKRSAF